MFSAYLQTSFLLCIFLVSFTGQNIDYPVPEILEKIDISVPLEGTLYDYTYHFKQKGNWKYWPDVLKTMHALETINIQQMLIPTTESVRFVSTIMEYNVKR
jgi:dynein heavy chain